jgi:hypothetical protein
MAVMAVEMEAEMLLVQATQAEQVVMMEQVETMLVEQVEVVMQLILEIWVQKQLMMPLQQVLVPEVLVVAVMLQTLEI